MFSINGSSQLSSLHIVKHISVVTYREKQVAIAAVRFGLTVLSKVVEIFNSKVEIGIDLTIGPTF